MDLPNANLLHAYHHRLGHEGGWQMVRTEEGRVITMPPRTELEILIDRARGPDSNRAA